MERFKCPYCGKSHPDTTIFCVQKQRALVRYPNTLLVSLALLAFASVLVTAFTQPVGKDDSSSFLTTVFIYKPWLFYSFIGLLLLVWEGSFLRARHFQRWVMWSVTVAALLIVGLVTARPDIITTIEHSQGLKNFFTNPWPYIIANLLFVLFWLWQTIWRRVRRDKTQPLPTLFSDTLQEGEENPAIAETEYTSGDLLAGSIIFLFSAFVFPFLFLVIARYALGVIPAAQAAGQAPPDFPWIFTHFSQMTSLRIDFSSAPTPTAGISLALLDLSIAALLFAISTISLLIVTYNQGLQEIQAVDTPAHTGTTGKLPTITPRSSIALPSLKDLTQADPGESLSSVLSTPSFVNAPASDADATTQEDVELAVGETVARTALAGLERALISLRLVAGSAALSIRNLLWPFAIFVGAALVAAMSGVVYTYLHYASKFPFSNWTNWNPTSGGDNVVSSLGTTVVSWIEIGGFGLIALALVTSAIALQTRTRAVLPDATSFLRYFGLLAILTFWIFAAALAALNVAYNLQEFVNTSSKGSFFYINNPWPLEPDLTVILSFILFLILAVPQLFSTRRKQQPRRSGQISPATINQASLSQAARAARQEAQASQTPAAEPASVETKTNQPSTKE